jgi:hypothetical protein
VPAPAKPSSSLSTRATTLLLGRLQLADRILSNGVYANFAYNAGNRLSHMVTKTVTGAVAQDVSYGRDPGRAVEARDRVESRDDLAGSART